jgi:hypothetical protein
MNLGIMPTWLAGTCYLGGFPHCWACILLVAVDWSTCKYRERIFVYPFSDATCLFLANYAGLVRKFISTLVSECPRL